MIARYGYLDNEMTSGNMSVDTQSNAFSLSVETGHMFRIMEQAYIEPQIEVTYGFISGDDATASNGVRLDQDDFQSLITRVGVRTGKRNVPFPAIVSRRPLFMGFFFIEPILSS